MADATTAAARLHPVAQRLDQLTKQIWDDINANDVVDAAPTDGGYLSDFVAIPPATEFCATDSVVTPAEGARFNVRMLRIVNGADGSSGVHNPFLAEALLRANIDELKASIPRAPGGQGSCAGNHERAAWRDN